jgi:hypothetical protein
MIERKDIRFKLYGRKEPLVLVEELSGLLEDTSFMMKQTPPPEEAVAARVVANIDENYRVRSYLLEYYNNQQMAEFGGIIAIHTYDKTAEGLKRQGKP